MKEKDKEISYKASLTTTTMTDSAKTDTNLLNFFARFQTTSNAMQHHKHSNFPS